MPVHYPKRNGFLYSFKSVQLLQGAQLFDGLMQVEANPSVDGGDAVFGTGPKGLGAPIGELHIELSFKMLLKSFFLYTKSRPNWMFEYYNLTLVNQEGSDRDRITLETVRITGTTIPSEGTDATVVEAEGWALDMRMNGKSICNRGSQAGAIPGF